VTQPRPQHTQTPGPHPQEPFPPEDEPPPERNRRKTAIILAIIIAALLVALIALHASGIMGKGMH
jgi:hypothetical protein